MTIRDLEIFITVVEMGTMSAAAKKLNISQPSISQSIAQIEQEYNVVLFDRISRKLFLTATGRNLLDYARRILDDVAEMKDTLLLSPPKDTFIIGVSHSVSTKFLRDLRRKLDEEMDCPSLHVVIEDNETILQSVKNGEVHVALAEGDLDDSHWKSEPLLQDHLYFICAKDHPLANRQRISLEDMANLPFAMGKSGTKSYEYILHLLRDREVPLQLPWTCHCYEAIFPLVEENLAVSLVPGWIIPEDSNLAVIPLEGNLGNINLSLFSLTYFSNPHWMETVKRAIRETAKL